MAYWLPEETEDAEIELIHKQLALFSIGSIQVQVDDSRFGLTTIEPPQEPLLRDLGIGTLSILEHTPLKAIGLNLDMVFVLESDDAWQAFGDKMVPKQRWTRILEEPGTQQIVVEGKRPECRADRVHVRIQRSGARRLLLAINQHYQLETSARTDVRERNNEAVRVLKEDWTSFGIYARDAASKLLEYTENGEHQA